MPSTHPFRPTMPARHRPDFGAYASALWPDGIDRCSHRRHAGPIGRRSRWRDGSPQQTRRLGNAVCHFRPKWKVWFSIAAIRHVRNTADKSDFKPLDIPKVNVHVTETLRSLCRHGLRPLRHLVCVRNINTRSGISFRQAQHRRNQIGSNPRFEDIANGTH